MISPKLFFKLLKYKSQKSDKFYDFKLIRRYFDNNGISSSFQNIPDNIANDLDIDNVFVRIDRTSSKIGRQFLYSKIRNISHHKELSAFDDIVSMFDNDIELRTRVKEQLSKLSSDDGYYMQEMFSGMHLKLTSIYIPYVLTFLFVSFLVIGFFYGYFILFLIPLFICNAVLHYSNKRNISYYIVGVSELGKSIKIAKSIIKESGIKNHYKNTPFVTKLSRIQHKASFIAFEKQYENEATSILLWIIELLKISINMEVTLFHLYHNDIVSEKENIEKLFCLIGNVDSAISVSELRAESIIWCKPQFVEDKLIDVEEIIHPMVDNCIPNTIKLSNESLLLTGSNMSGKTTFIRAMAINVILSQTIYFCFAKAYRASYFNIYTSIRISDSIENKTSYFLEEVLAIKHLVDQASQEECCLFVLDEIFKGTNTIERISAAKSILAYLNNSRHVVLVSTHDIELMGLLSSHHYQCYNFSEQIAGGKLLFDYKLHYGVLMKRNAIKILELHDFPDAIIKDALETQNYVSSHKI